MDYSSNFGLTQRDLDTITQLFRAYPSIHKVGIFGSRALGKYNLGSDVDLVIMDKTTDFKTIMKRRDDFKESSLPYRVDILHYASLKNPDLIEHINRAAKVIYED